MTTLSTDVKPIEEFETTTSEQELGASSQIEHYPSCDAQLETSSQSDQGTDYEVPHSPEDQDLDDDLTTQIQNIAHIQNDPVHSPSAAAIVAAAPATSSAEGDGSFDCNICLELAQDPVVTLCGHLFCWPCLYRWLQVHSLSQDCPVCKANVEEEKVIPLYGRGKVGSVDPRTKTVLGMNIPHRPSGHRPDFSRHNADQMHHYHPLGFNYMSGPGGPTASTRFGDITLSAGFGLFPSLFGFHIHGLQDGGGGGGGMHGQGLPGGMYSPPPMTHDQQQEAQLSRILLLLGCLVILCLLFF